MNKKGVVLQDEEMIMRRKGGSRKKYVVERGKNTKGRKRK